MTGEDHLIARFRIQCSDDVCEGLFAKGSCVVELILLHRPVEIFQVVDDELKKT